MKKDFKVQKSQPNRKKSIQNYKKGKKSELKMIEKTRLRLFRPLPGTEICPRCSGLMVKEYCFDYRDDSGKLAFLAFRCILCGERIDPIIIKNRHHRPIRRQIQREDSVTFLKRTSKKQKDPQKN
ncbi:MAG TPA: hypothetical protein VGB26_07930 [Nitrospiria bacterium]|jgi:hypothetical protein